MKIRCLIVDDEPLSVRVLEKYAAELPQLELLDSCSNAFAAMEVLQRERVDLLLLDINMPKLSGISFLKSLSNPPLVVFITAYPEHAVEGFELEAVDYLLKPFSFERFVKAINRVAQKRAQATFTEEQSSILIKADKKLYQLNPLDIQYLQAYGDYVKIFTGEKTLVTKERLIKLEAMLSREHFQRIHRSYIVALSAIEFIEGNQVKVGTAKLPVAVTYKEALLLKLKKN